MWIGIIVAAVVVYFLFFHEEPKKKRSRSRKTTSSNVRHNSKADIPGINWVFQREIDEPGVPAIVNTYRRALNGKSFTEIVKMIYVATELQKDKIQSALTIIQLTEPLLELMKLKYLENYEVEAHLKVAYSTLIESNSTIGAIGQLNNIRDLYYFFNREIPILEKDLLGSFNEVLFRKIFMAKLKETEFIFKKDLKEIEEYDNIEFKEAYLNRLVRYNQIIEDKNGRFIIYKRKEK